MGQEILSWVLTILVAVAAALVIRSFIFEPVKVDGGSMDDTLANGEIMLVSKYDFSSTWLCLPWQDEDASQQAPRITFGTPNRLDVVICRYPARGAVNFVKRIVGLPGDTVELREGFLYINEQQVEEEKDLINPDYRVSGGSNGYTFPAYYVPKKGDRLAISGSSTRLQYSVLPADRQADGETGENWINWDRKSTCVVAKDQDGKSLKIYKHTQKGTVISYDGKEWTGGSWAEILPTLTEKTFTFDEDYYFVMGDHRNNSNDSRSVGVLERSAIIGHVRRVVLPFSAWKYVN